MNRRELYAAGEPFGDSATRRKLGGGYVCGGGGGGGGSSSSSNSSTTTMNTDKRLVVDSGVGVSSDQSTVNVTSTDLGAISQAFGFAGASGAKALDFATAGGERVAGTMDKVLGLADTLLKGSLTAVADTNNLVNSAYETARTTEKGTIDQKTMIVLAVTAAGAAIFIAGRKK